MFRGEELEDGQILGVAGLVLFGLRIGELAEGFQGGDGGHKEGLVARSFHATGGCLNDLVVGVGLLGRGRFGLLRAEPALHRLAEDGGTLGLAQCRALPGGGACPAFFELAEVAANVQSRLAQSLGNLAAFEALEVQPLDFGQIGFPVDARRFFFFDFFVH